MFFLVAGPLCGVVLNAMPARICAAEIGQGRGVLGKLSRREDRVASTSDFWGYWQRAYGLRVLRATSRKNSYLLAFHDEVWLRLVRAISDDAVAKNEALVSPFFDPNLHLEVVAVARSAYKSSLRVDQRRPEHPYLPFRRTPIGNTEMDEEVSRGSVNPSKEVGKPNDASWIAITKLHVDGMDHVVRWRREGRVHGIDINGALREEAWPRDGRRQAVPSSKWSELNRP